MKAQVKFEWRQLQEPEGHQDPAYVIMNALKEAGYSVASTPDVKGIWDEDKPARLGGPWDETRLPHEEITKPKIDPIDHLEKQILLNQEMDNT